ncbi:MAG: uncharacterized protein JWR70_1408 [Modestobacter sp.]|jgi:hypothetical protein|nr:uncharacterized protein [Modestobacter sp.]
MSTDSTDPHDPTQVGPTEGPPAPDAATSDAATSDAPAEERAPGRIDRNTPLLISILVAVIVAAVAIGALSYYRTRVDDRDAATAAAFVRTITTQGATVDTVECHGDICAAIIGNQAYTVLVQEDAQGRQHFGVSAYVGP